MTKKVEEVLVKAIKTLAGKITEDIKADEALKYTQAALNASHTIITLKNVNQMT